ncbi:hypothetical protein ACH3VR_21410 [Microbacterium sp. B2969]|uniref:Uncharacterized protein n=1 Tax=Microbacterium alkaliflavum TaxID=3248839 RepID=A0ABW7QDF5_9MICO
MEVIGMMGNPYALDDLLDEDGVSLYDDRPWSEQAEARRSAARASTETAEDVVERLFGTPGWAHQDLDEAEAIEEYFNAPAWLGNPNDIDDVLHGVHFSGCQDDGRELIITRCGIAVDASGQGGTRSPLAACAACDAVKACPVCGARLPLTVSAVLSWRKRTDGLRSWWRRNVG